MNLVNKEYHKRARILLENWQDSRAHHEGFEIPTDEALPSLIELSLLSADASISEVNKLCKFAREYGVAGIVVNPTHVERCVQILGDGLPVGTVIGFPLGANHPQIKMAEANLAVQHGAKNLNTVINIGLLKTSNFQEVFEELRAVRHACPESELTIILETSLLEPLQTIIASMLCREAGADAVMTSTGFNNSAAILEDVSLLRSIVGDDLHLVASGSIAGRHDVEGLLKAGASRLTVEFSAIDVALAGLVRRSD
ncbi:MAG: deoxyribose-phosphate aldolase [Candidatus Marinimicrobia bacterium]|nr:deoxyribose-phosphate aldolase [Candidatus Neomarinimicrobiota bacterium]